MGARAVIALLLLLAMPLGASSRRVRLAPERYAAAWQRVRACSGRSPLAGHELSHLVILAEPSLALDGHRILALWVPGDTVFLTPAVSDTSWVIAHELLHALMQGPSPAAGGPHPLEPFAFPCELMPWQHAAGGIMGVARP